MTCGVSISDITFYTYDVESGDEITNEDGSIKTFVLKEGEVNMLEEIEE